MLLESKNMTSLTNELALIGIFVVCALLFAAVHMLSFISKAEFEHSAYEYGFLPFEDSLSIFRILLLLIAIIFLLLDIEVLYHYPIIRIHKSKKEKSPVPPVPSPSPSIVPPNTPKILPKAKTPPKSSIPPKVKTPLPLPSYSGDQIPYWRINEDEHAWSDYDENEIDNNEEEEEDKEEPEEEDKEEPEEDNGESFLDDSVNNNDQEDK